MAKNSIDAYGALGKSNVLFFDPATLVLVTDEASALYDSRVHLPVSESLVLNIMALGVLQAISVAKNPETGAVEVVAGRQRVKAAREANRRLAAQGSAPVQIPAIPRKDTKPASLASVMVSENELREDDTPIGRAEKMVKLQGLGRSDGDLAVIFGCGVATIRSTMALLEAPAAVRDAVQSGAIGVGHAKALAKLPPEQQREKVAQLAEVSATSAGHERARRQRAVVEPGSTQVKMRGRAEVTSAWAAAPENSIERLTLAWVLGKL
jgi:ParB family chromosome partitioning protein